MSLHRAIAASLAEDDLTLEAKRLYEQHNPEGTPWWEFSEIQKEAWRDAALDQRKPALPTRRARRLVERRPLWLRVVERFCGVVLS